MAGTHPFDSLGLPALFPGEISSHETNKFLAETSSEGLLACASDTPTTILSREASSNDPDSFTQSQGECSDPEAATISLCLTKLNGDVAAVRVSSRDRTESLRRLAWDLLSISPAEQQLICQGCVVLENGKMLCEQGVNDGDLIQVVSSIVAAQRVEVRGHRWFSNVDGVYKLALKEGDRPIYQNDSFRLAYDASASRWAITDGASWSKHSDRSYAYCENDTDLPYDLPEPWKLSSGGMSYSQCASFSVTPCCEDEWVPLASPALALP